LKENVIIGKLIPSGTGFSDKRIDTINAMTEKDNNERDERDKRDEREKKEGLVKEVVAEE